MAQGGSMDELTAIDISDRLTELIIKLEYLTISHYGFLGWVQEIGSISDDEISGFIQVHEGFIAELKAFKKDLDPHTTKLIELERASKIQQ